MPKYIASFFLATLFLSACNGNKSEKDIIKSDEMINLMTDMHIIDGSMYNSVSQSPDSLYKFGIAKYLALFQKYHTDSVQFRKSLDFYTRRPVELSKMYEVILNRLQKKTDSLNKKLLKNQSAPPKI
jgi:Domain of unknown function (DUF4296)